MIVNNPVMARFAHLAVGPPLAWCARLWRERSEESLVSYNIV